MSSHSRCVVSPPGFLWESAVLERAGPTVVLVSKEGLAFGRALLLRGDPLCMLHGKMGLEGLTSVE